METLTSFLAACAVIGTVFVVLFTLDYFAFESQWGAPLAKQLLPQRVALGVMLLPVWILIFIKDFPNREIIGLGIGAVAFGIACGNLLAAARRSAEGHFVLLDISETNQTSIGSIGVILLLGVFAAVSAWVNPEQRVTSVLAGLGFFTFAGMLILRRRRGTRFTRTGIYLGQTFIKWEQVQSVHWGTRRGGVDALLIQYQRRLPIFNAAVIRAPATYKGAINELLTRYTPRPR